MYIEMDINKVVQLLNKRTCVKKQLNKFSWPSVLVSYNIIWYVSSRYIVLNSITGIPKVIERDK